MRQSQTPTSVIFFLLLLLLSSGCQPIKPTYTKEKIAEAITSLCQEEYSINPRVWLIGETVWIYLPLPKLITKDIKWDKENSEKINKVMMSASRVVLSMKPRPKFMVVVASDTQQYGIDYTIITWIPDIVKYQLQFISRDEFSRRNIIKIKENPQALNDAEGDHLEKIDIIMGEFLAGQIAQRIYARFSLDPKLKDYLKVDDARGTFKDESFNIAIDLKQIRSMPEQSIDTQKEIMKIIVYVIKEYDFKDFLLVEVSDSLTNEKSIFSRAALMDLRKR